MKTTIRIARPSAILVWLLITFLVLFPKGGIKFGGIPLTWGYLFVGLSFIPLLAVRMLVMPTGQTAPALFGAAVLLPFQLLFCYSFLQNGVSSFGFLVALVTAFFFLPTVFLLIYPAFLRFIDPVKFRRHFCFCVLAAAIWGIFQFFYHPIMHKYIEIPLLTVNAGDYGMLESTKHINRGGYLKLISTYNNGNVYGVATLILLPLFLRLEPSLWKRNVVRLALVLTLSRTVWVGLLFEQILSLGGQIPNLLERFPRVRPGRAMKQAVGLLGTGALVFIGSLFFGATTAALFLDRSFGGRAGEFHGYTNVSLLPQVPITTFDEVVYASALRNYGILGLLAVILIFISPILFLMADRQIFRSPVRRAAAKGLIIYALLAAADGALILIPVMAFYWFCYMTMLFGLGGRKMAAKQGEPVIPGTALPA